MLNNNKSKITATVITSIILSVLLVISIILNCGIYFGDWFKKSNVSIGSSTIDTETEENLADNVVIGTGISSGKLSITSSGNASLTSSSVGYVEDNSVTLTAVYNSDASNPTFTWTSSSTSITLTPSSDTLSCTVTLNGTFSSQIIITCTADDNSSVYATCTVDYVKRLTDASLVFTEGNYFTRDVWDSLTLSSSGSTTTYTIDGDEWNDSFSDNSSTYFKYGAFFEPVITYSYGSGSLTETYSSLSCVFNFGNSIGSKDIYVDEYEEINLSALISTLACTYNSGSEYYSSSRFYSYISDSNARSYYYNNLLSAYESGEGITIDFEVTGDITGRTYTFSYTLLLDPSELYTSVNSVSLNLESIAF